MMHDLAGVTDKDFANMIYRALVAGCGDGTYFESHELGLMVKGTFSFDIVAHVLCHALQGQRIDNAGELPPWQKPSGKYRGE
jgi:hypothetical protein